MTASLAWPHISLVSIVDILLVAILIYQLLTRRLPFEDEDPGFLVQ